MIDPLTAESLEHLMYPTIPWLSGWALALLTLVMLVFAPLSVLLERSSPIRLRHWAEEAGGGLRGLYDQPACFESFRFLITLATGVAPVFQVLFLWVVLRDLGVGGAFWSAPLLVSLLLLALEWGSRTLVERHAEQTLSMATVLLRVLHRVFWPLIWLLAYAVALDDPDEEEGDDEDEVSDEEIEAYIDVGRREGILEPEEEKLVRSIVDFGDTQARSVMTPRVEMVTAAVDASLEELAEVFFASKRSRIPLYRGSVDQVVGILHIRDLFEGLQGEGHKTAEELVKTPHYVPESKALRELLEELQSLHQTMAIVVDEYGGVSGLVTVEDLVEEIVGEINDEHETTGVFPVVLDEYRWRFHGRTDLELLAETLDLDVDLDDLPYETVSGLICGELGYVPKEGETIETYGLVFSIEEADERRITGVIVQRATVAEEDKEA
jgi:CBS domain containing-hemolysin-like protein